jgi:proteasome lid subunit RPN8/RPN11
MNAADPGPRGTPASDEPAIQIRQAVLDDLIAHARMEAPNECCGMLIGTRERIERAVRARNALGSQTRYLIDPRDQFAAIKIARERGESVVGFYHSHPSSPATPSDRDRVEAAYPGHCYLIVSPGSSTGPGEVRGFRLHTSGNFTAITLVPFP